MSHLVRGCDRIAITSGCGHLDGPSYSEADFRHATLRLVTRTFTLGQSEYLYFDHVLRLCTRLGETHAAGLVRSLLRGSGVLA